MSTAVTIKLSEPISINGIKTDTLHLRRPKIKDIRAARIATTDDDERELRLFALLADCAPSDLEELDFADYRKIQDEFQAMLAH